MRNQLAFTRFAAAARQIGALVLGLVTYTLGPCLSASAQGTFTTFDAPGAVNGTFSEAINPEGTVTGYYRDANSVSHGFARAPDGTFVTFDAPGDVGGTSPSAMNSAGSITGSFCGVGIACEAFLRTTGGAFQAFYAPGAVFGTYPAGINSASEIVGSYYDANFVSHGFVRASDGAITTFNAPGAGTSSGGTYADGINPQGTVSGCYVDANSVSHGFVAAKDGTLTRFDVPGSQGTGCFGLFIANVVAINPSGALTGGYFEPIEGNPFGGNWRGFLRAPDGTFTTFDAATGPCCIWTYGVAINSANGIAGYYNDGSDVNHGFLRASDGTVTILAAPGAGTSAGQGTIADGINPGGQITGYYTDGSDLSHGFVWTP